MFLDAPSGGPGDLLAITQPAHAWISGQLLRQWAAKLDGPLLLAAEQHDLAWLDWELAPSFDPATGRPRLFRDIGAAAHAPLWSRAVQRACAAWGSRVALLVSRHGTVIYTRFTGRHRLSDADAGAAKDYVERQAPIQAAWARVLRLADHALERDTDLIAFADTLSLALCGALPLPLELDGPGRENGQARYRLVRQAGGTARLFPVPLAVPRRGRDDRCGGAPDAGRTVRERGRDARLVGLRPMDPASLHPRARRRMPGMIRSPGLDSLG